jgi:hypothetical protein
MPELCLYRSHRQSPCTSLERDWNKAGQLVARGRETALHRVRHPLPSFKFLRKKIQYFSMLDNRVVVQIGTYNANLQAHGGLPQNLVDWLVPSLKVSSFLSRERTAPDIVAIGFQELLPLQLGCQSTFSLLDLSFYRRPFLLTLVWGLFPRTCNSPILQTDVFHNPITCARILISHFDF